MYKMWLAWNLAVLIIMSHSVLSDAVPKDFNYDVCQPGFNTAGNRPFPYIPNSFVAKFAWNDHQKRQTMHVQEWYSQENDAGTMFVTGQLAPGVTSQYITYGKTQEYFTIYDVKANNQWDNCRRQVLSSDEIFALPVNMKNGKDVIVSGRTLLNLGGTSVGDTMYVGKDIVKDIDVDVWQTCLFVKSSALTLNVTYYFSSNDTSDHWSTPGGISSEPIRIQVHGVATVTSPNGPVTKKLEQTFEYVYFTTHWPSLNPDVFEKVFETPEGAYCAGRTNTFPLPVVPQWFSFEMEVIDHVADTILVSRESYDFRANYSRIDFKDPPTGNASVDAATSPKTLINDFNTGVTYAFDKYTGECFAMPIIGGEFDSEPLSKSSTTRMKTPKEFFDFDNTGKWPYQYMGEHDVRGVQCNSWISFRPYPNEVSNINATWQWYFAKKDTVIKVREFAENLEPMMAIVTVPEKNINLQYNFFRFSEEEPSSSFFDVSLCFQDSRSVSFEFQLQGDWKTYELQNNQEALRYWFLLSIESFTGVRSIRVQDVEFEFFDNRIQCRCTILGPAPIAGDVSNDVQQLDIKTAVNRLAKSFDNGLFEMYYTPNRNVTPAEFVPVRSSLRIIERKEHKGSYRPKDEVLPDPVKHVGPGLNAGAAVGLAFGLIALGAVVAVIGVFLHMRRSAPAVNYKKHRLDQEEAGDQ